MTLSYAIVGMSHSIKHKVGAVNRPALQLLSSCYLWNKHCFKRSNLTLALSSALSIATLISASQSVTLVIILWSLANKNRQTLLICSCSYGWHPSEVLFTLITNYIEPSPLRLLSSSLSLQISIPKMHFFAGGSDVLLCSNKGTMKKNLLLGGCVILKIRI